MQKAIENDTPAGGQRAGGYIRVEYNSKLIEGHQQIKAWAGSTDSVASSIDLSDYFDSPISQGIYKEHFCTAMFDFEAVKTNEFKVHIWTSRHCLTFPFIDEIEIYVSTGNGYIPVRIENEFKQLNDSIGQFLGSDLDAFLSFFLINKSSQFRNTINSRLLSDFLASPGQNVNDLENHQKQIDAFQRPLCNSYRKDTQLKIFDSEKLCFSAKDLVLVSGTLLPNILPKNEQIALLDRINASIQFRQEFAKDTANLVPIFTEWRNIIETTTMASYFEKLRAVHWYLANECPDGSMIDPKLLCENQDARKIVEIEYLRAEKEMSIRLKRLQIPEDISVENKPRSRFDVNLAGLGYLDIVNNHLRPAWQILVQNIADHSQMQVLTNVKSENNQMRTFRSIPYANIINFNNYPPFITPLGFAHLLPKGGIKFVASDSGSIVTLGGYYPIVALSTVNDDEVTGGYSKKDIPAYKPNPADLAKPQPEAKKNSDPSVTSPNGSDATDSASTTDSSIYDDGNLGTSGDGKVESIRKASPGREPACG